MKLQTEFTDVTIFGKRGLRIGIFNVGADHYIDYQSCYIPDTEEEVRLRMELQEWAESRIKELMIIKEVSIIDNVIKCHDEDYPLTIVQCQDCAYHHGIEDNKVQCSYLTSNEYEEMLNESKTP